MGSIPAGSTISAAYMRRNTASNSACLGSFTPSKLPIGNARFPCLACISAAESECGFDVHNFTTNNARRKNLFALFVGGKRTHRFARPSRRRTPRSESYKNANTAQRKNIARKITVARLRQIQQRAIYRSKDACNTKEQRQRWLSFGNIAITFSVFYGC